MGTINAFFDKDNIVFVRGDGATRNYYYNGIKMISEEEEKKTCHFLKQSGIPPISNNRF